MNEAARVLVVDDQRLFLDGLVAVLSLRSDEVDVVGVAEEGEAAVEMYSDLRPDVVLLDIRMHGMDGVEAAKAIRRIDPDARLLMLTTFDDRDLISAALAAGAHGYVLKDTPVDQLLLAIRTVQGGGVTFSDRAFRSLRTAETIEPLDTDGSTNEPTLESGILTPQQCRILSLVARGKNNAQIAEELGIREKTIRNYLTEIYDIIDVHSRTQALLWALKHQL